MWLPSLLTLSPLLAFLPTWPSPPADYVTRGVESGRPPRLPPHLARHASAVPLVDGHIDLPVLLRVLYNNDLDRLPKQGYRRDLPGQVDLDRLHRGGVGGFFSIAYVPCPAVPEGEDGKPDFLAPNHNVRDTLEQIDVTKELVARYPESIAQPRSVDELLRSHRRGLVSHIVGIEGAHSLGNSLAALRQYFELGARYLTLTHTCHNAFADSSGSSEGVAIPPLHGGLSAFGRRLVREMNRLGMIVDVSHTSDDTARQALELSEAPVVFSHSGARAVWNHTRNLPDDVLRLVAEKDALVMVPFVSFFVHGGDDSGATVEQVADHVDHVASLAGRRRVGLGSDFDGALEFPRGLEDVSRYPNLLRILSSRGWSASELDGLRGANFVRTWRRVERVGERLRRKKGSGGGGAGRSDMAVWAEGRPDLRREWS